MSQKDEGYQEALKRIEQARSQGATVLDLTSLELTELPFEIKQLTNLQGLFVSHNKLTSLPLLVGELTNLQTLDLQNNQLANLPPQITRLINLKTLGLHNNQLASLTPEVTRLTNLNILDLHNNQLTSLPSEVGNLTNLQELILSGNQLTDLPPEVGNLTNLKSLHISNNQLTSLSLEISGLTYLQDLFLSSNKLFSLPSEVGNLKNLKRLNLSRNQLINLPHEISGFTKLKRLYLSDNQLLSLPPEVGNLTNLEFLDLNSNQLTNLPPEVGNLTNLVGLDLNRNQLTSLPPDVGKLINLRVLRLRDNQLTSLPREVGNLKNLHTLSLRENQLTSLFPGFEKLTNLQDLYLSRNQFTSLPPEVLELTNLMRLSLDGNQLSSLPPEIGELTNLKGLYLFNNQLTSLPPDVGKLTNLQYLNISSNQLTRLPPDIGKLPKLEYILLDDNPLESPPNEIIEQGTEGIMAFFDALLAGSQQEWVSKLLVVGEGGTGKTQIIRHLRRLGFDSNIDTTHGIEIEKVEVPHPEEKNVTMRLNSWDFGGQQIYHATHQFFLTNRSLFLLVWNARLGYEQGKLYYWLDRIQALAPDSPIILVATHIDMRDADIPLEELKSRYPQVVDQVEVSNTEEIGFEKLTDCIVKLAVRLPLMGQLWPTKWLGSAEAIRAREEKHITPKKLKEIMLEHEVVGRNANVMARWLHELGDLLFFQEDEELNDTVILQPQWVSKYISDVLESEEVINRLGIFTKNHMRELWSDLPVSMQDHFLRLMEQFDLSYRTLRDRDISLVVERLPLDPPKDYDTYWKELKGANEISMKFELNTIPAGIPTWFIARSHRFTTYTHWRNGAVFADDREKKTHLALAQAFTHERCVQLSVRGPYPHNFFALLKDGIELTLARFPGLIIDRKIPCPCSKGEPCSHEFDYEDIKRAIERDPPVLEVQCSKSFDQVSVPGLLFGIHYHAQGYVIERIDQLEETLKEEILDLRKLAQREFLNAYRREQALIESHCPNLFVLRPRERNVWQKLVLGEKIDLQLYCQAPGEWHPTKEGGLYGIDRPADWLRKVGPYLQNMVKLLKYVSPLIGPWVAVADAEYEKLVKNDIKLMNELIKKMPEIIEEPQLILADKLEESLEPFRAEGAGLRAIRQILNEVDPHQVWGNLKKVPTPEGHVYWLCEHHAEEYK